LKKTSLIFIFITGMVLVGSGTVLAAEGSGGNGFIPADWQDFILRMINLVLFLAVIYMLAGNKIKDFFSGRRAQISDELQNMEDRKKEAEKKLQEVEKSIANIEQERQEILDQAKQQGEALKKSIVDKAHEDAERIRQQATVKSSQEFQQAIDYLRSELAEEVIKSAEQIIQQRMGKEEQEKLIDNYLTKVVVN